MYYPTAERTLDVLQVLLDSDIEHPVNAGQILKRTNINGTYKKGGRKGIYASIAQIEYLGNLLQDNKNLSRRIEEFNRVLEKNQVLEQFDRSVFESMIEKVIVGGIDDEGKKGSL